MFGKMLLHLPLVLALGVTAAPTPALAHAPGEVHLVTATPESWVAHAIRHDDGRWDQFNPLPTDLGPAENVSSTVSGGEEHLVYQVRVFPKPALYDTYLRTRHLDGTWSQERIDLDNQMSGPTAVAVVNGELHVLRQDSYGTRHRVRHIDGSWSPTTRIPFAGYGASVANVNGVLHFMVTSGDSNTVLRLMTWQADGTWSEPVDTAVLPQPHGWFANAEIAQVGTELHAVVKAADGGLRHAIRRPDGSWTAWGDIGQEAGVPGTADAIAVTASRNTLQVAITTTEGGLFHTIRFANGTWQRFGDVKGAAGHVDSREVTIAGE